MMCFSHKDRKRVKTNHCIIVLLDDTQLVHELHPSTTGQDLLDVAIKHLNLLETSYFGLSYLRPTASRRNNGHTHTGGPLEPAGAQYYGYSAGAGQPAGQPADQVWLDVNRSAIKQLRQLQPMTVYFGVKYYAPDPCKLAEEITRYQFFLQCKRDILQARLPVSFELAVELLALAVQSELGDYDPARHRDNYVSEFHFLPGQTLELERQAARWHRQLLGQVPATAELNFLERVKWLDLYGCELHPIQYDDDHHQYQAGPKGAPAADSYALGLGPSGLLVLRNQARVASYAWPRIVRSKCQGRCFLIDVVLELAGAPDQRTAAKQVRLRSSRFGFRLADKEAAARLRWSLEEHKSFHQLLVQSQSGLVGTGPRRRLPEPGPGAASVSHMEQVKLSQRFRNSIRSAIGIGAGPQQHQHQQQFEQQHRKLLRSSIKSLGAAVAAERQAPTVIRMPSRRYSRCNTTQQQHHQQGSAGAAYQANGLAAPPAPLGAPGSAHTMVDSQRHRALMMLSDFNQQHQFSGVNGFAGQAIGKSQTLRPMKTSQTANDKDSKQRNPYYQMMMMLAAQQHQAQLQQQLRSGRAPAVPEIAILPPGQHLVQPSIYKAQSVINGIDQLANESRFVGQQLQPDLVLMRPAKGAYASPSMTLDRRYAQRAPSGHESPRSTKSAMAPISALRLASKKLAAKQQQLIYGDPDDHPTSGDLRPLLGMSNKSGLYGNDERTHGVANASPRSARSLRVLQAADHEKQRQMQGRLEASIAPARHQMRSKSTGENLHLLHRQQAQNYLLDNMQSKASNRLLLTTATSGQAQQQMHSLPPPDYQADTNRAGLVVAARACFDGQAHSGEKAPRSFSANRSNNQPLRAGAASDDEDGYCCSRSDCSSVGGLIEANDNGGGRQRRPIVEANTRRQARSINGQLVNAGRPPKPGQANDDQPDSREEPSDRGISQLSKSQEALYGTDKKHQQLADWDAIKRRHSEFSHGKGPLGQFEIAPRSNNKLPVYSRDANNNNSNSGHGGGDLVKNIANKQATPILLTMNQGAANQRQQTSDANHQAVQLLNMQRQQLLNTHQNQILLSDANNNNNNHNSNNINAKLMSNATCRGGSTSTADQSSSISANSSVASSPKTPLGSQSKSQMPFNTAAHQRQTYQAHNNNNINNHHQAADSTASNSTTSGYYAGSNSTGPASVDSGDTINGTECGNRSPLCGTGDRSLAPANRQQRIQTRTSSGNNNNPLGGPMDRCLVLGGGKKFSPGLGLTDQNPITPTRPREYQRQQQDFYLEESANQNDVGGNSDDCHPLSSKTTTGTNQRQQHWSPLEQIQQHPPSSLKYVSFDV